MKRMYETQPTKKVNNTITIKASDLHLRNELHFQACLMNNAYVQKNKKKVIPRKQKYKNIF